MRITLRNFDKETNSFSEARLKKSVSLYSGVVDKNGKKIFTGDIVGICSDAVDDSGKNVIDKFTGIVIFKDSAFCVDFIDATYWYDDLMMLGVNDDIVVIGNIWQDSDIVKALENKVKV